MPDNNAPSRVPCDGCTACCHGQAIFLKPDKGDVPEQYQTKPWNNPVRGEIMLMLDHEENGDCIYLGETGCTIYARRPFQCQAYDCRKLFLTIPHKNRKRLIAAGQLHRKVENAARKRISTLTDAEVLHCQAKKKVILSKGGGHAMLGDGRPTG